MCPCVSLSCVETVLWFWNAPPLPRGLRLWGRRQGLSSASSTEKEAAERLEAGEFPVRSWGREGLYTLSCKLEPHGARSGVSSQDFLKTRGSSSGAKTCIIFLPPHLSLAQKKRFYPVITLGQQNIKGPSIPQRGKKKKLGELHRRVQAWKYGVYREKIYF